MYLHSHFKIKTFFKSLQTLQRQRFLETMHSQGQWTPSFSYYNEERTRLYFIERNAGDPDTTATFAGFQMAFESNRTGEGVSEK